MHCARVASHAGDFESAHTIVPYSAWAAVSHGQPSFTSAWRGVRSRPSPQRRCAGDTKSQIDTPIHQGQQADVHQVRRPPVAEQPDRGRKHDGRADHAEQTAQPLPMTEPTQRVRQQGERGKQRQQAADGAAPSYWLKKPSPMAAPKLARAGKQAAQPIAETTLPSAPVLSAMRVISPMKRLSLLSLACWLTA